MKSSKQTISLTSQNLLTAIPAYGISPILAAALAFLPSAEATPSDWMVYQDQFNAGANEALADKINLFNANSAGTIQLSANAIRGNYEQKAFFKRGTGMVVDRDPNSVAGVVSKEMAQGEVTKIKLYRRIEPYDVTLSALRATNLSPQEYSFSLGQQIGDSMVEDYIETAITAMVAATLGEATLNADTGVGNPMTHSQFVDLQRMKGDQAGNIAAYVMHSVTKFDLQDQTIVDNVYNLGAVTITTGSAISDKPIISADLTALIDVVPVVDQYFVLALDVGAIKVEESETRYMAMKETLNKANIVMTHPGEHAFNLSLAGYTWDLAAGGTAPNAAAVGTTANWDIVAYTPKACGACMLSVPAKI